MSPASTLEGGPGRATTVGVIAAVEAWAHGRNPYGMSRAAWFAFGPTLHIQRFVWPYRYPPYTAALLRPFISFGEPAVRIAWQSASVASMLAAAWLTARALGGRWRYAVALLLLFVFAPAYDTLLVGQINGFLVLSLALALWAIVRRRDAVLGVSLAVGTVLKLVPAALFVYFLARRRWRASVWFVIGLAVLTLVALPLVGGQAFIGYGSWAVDLVRPQLVTNGPMNVTFVGALRRLFRHDLDLARTLGRLLGAAALLATVVVCWPRRDRPPDDLLAFSMIVTLLGLLGVLVAAADGTWILINPAWWLGFHPPSVYYAIWFPTLLCAALWAIRGLERWRESHSREPERRPELSPGK